MMVLLPVLLKNVLSGRAWLGHGAGGPFGIHVIVGALIIVFLIAEPHGLAQLWRVAKEKLRLVAFPALGTG